MTPATSRQPIRRRGALLLLVLISLTFFMLIGTLMLVTATRARSTARAFAEATARASAGASRGDDALDEALLLLLRGPMDPPPASVPFTESILEDKYGATTITGTASALAAAVATGAVASSGFLTLTVSETTTSWPALPGRILTLRPAADSTWHSFRIVAVDGNDVHLLNLPSRAEVTSLPLGSGTFHYRINGREFTPAAGGAAPESYDAYDDANAWLAQPMIVSGTPRFGRLTYGGTGAAMVSGTAATVDNDNDGLPDGVWITGTTGFLASRRSPEGGTLSYKVSYLVLDLDGRINVNAAGMSAPPANGTYGPNVPLGMGYGPADLDASLVVAGELPAEDGFSEYTRSTVQNRADLKWNSLVVGGTPAVPGTATPSQRRPPPMIGSVIGRYGTNGSPGIVGDDGLSSAASGFSSAQITTGSAYRHLYSGTSTLSGTAGNAVADLKGQVKIFSTAPTIGQLMPSMTFQRPVPGLADATDDPYEVRLDRSGPRPAVAATGTTAATVSDDNVYTMAELERVLRPYDNDAPALSGRLAVVLNDRADACRFLLTTDSWSAPVLTGTAATLVEDALTNGLSPKYDYSGGSTKVITGWKTVPPSNASAVALSPETAAGLKFDINRVMTTGSARQAYLRGLYTLALIMTGGTDAAAATLPRTNRAAQWAVNVLDFRDEDSVITGFEYDTNPFDGWDVDGNLTTTNDQDLGVAWGFERPELVIAETAAWGSLTPGEGQLFVNLVRPGWDAREVTASGTAARELMSSDLGDGDLLDIGVVNGSTSNFPVWQVRFLSNGVSKGVAQIVTPTGNPERQSQDVVSSGTVATITSEVHQSSVTVPGIPANGQICVFTPGTVNYFITATGTSVQAVAIDKDSAGKFFDQGCTELTLERLADPKKPNAKDNPYITVDRAPVTLVLVPDPVPPGFTFTKSRRRGPNDVTAPTLAAFWKADFLSESRAAPVSLGHYSQYISPGKPVPWFHWPNRPFVSAAELALVPADSTSDVLFAYSLSANAPVSSLASGTAGPILDAVHVRSPFAGTSIFVSGTAKGVAAFGFNELTNHTGQIALSALREPGRVNVNTIVGGTSTTQSTDSLVWATLVGGTTVQFSGGTMMASNPFTTGGASAAKSLTGMLSLSSAGGRPVAMQQFGLDSGTVGPRDANPFLAYAAAIRLANTATVSSNVFAVWMTLEITDDSPSAPSTTYRRMFAIIDRSIPVGFSPGETLNVRDAIVLKRVLD
jgi:hypothetical protein